MDLATADRLAALLRAGCTLREAAARLHRARSGLYKLLRNGEASRGHWHTRYAYEAVQRARGRPIAGPERYRKLRQQRALR